MIRKKITHERRHIGLRTEILDELLSSNKRRNYTDLLEALNEKLEENGEIPISERTLKYDIAFLENKKNAPIHRPAKEDPAVYYKEKFSLKKVPVDDDDIAFLKKAVAILKKATDIKLTLEIDGIISKLENKIHTNVPDSNSMIAFEEHTQAKGNEYFDEIFSAIQEKSPIKIIYQPFDKPEREWIIHPYMLKEYRNRWFLIGRIGNYPNISNIALDRIKGKIKNSKEPFIENDIFEPETYFNSLIGVSVPKDQSPLEIIIKVHGDACNYILTKPIHRSQTIVRTLNDGYMTICINVYDNYELRSTLLSYGKGVEIVMPDTFRNDMKGLLQEGLSRYENTE